MKRDQLKKPHRLCDSVERPERKVLQSCKTLLLKTLYPERKNLLITAYFLALSTGSVVIQRPNVNAMKESRKKYANFVIF